MMSFHYIQYHLLTIVLSPFIFLQIVWLAIKNRQARYFWQRLGFGYSSLPENCLWFHCASVGEAITLLPLIKNVHDKNKSLNFVITSNTITGARIIQQQDLAYLYHSYLPFDWHNTVKRFITRLKPVSLFVMETEIWPTLFTLCHAKDIPVHIINARLSKKTTGANKWIKSLLSYSLSKVSAIYSRSAENSDAYRKLGAAESIIQTTGNLKLTTAISHDINPKKKFSIDREYVILASTHADEEKQIHALWQSLDRQELLIIAPRHPERRDHIIKQLNSVNIAIRSKNQLPDSKTEVYLLDTVGELNGLFADAKLVIMGGSFTPVGGHNILEPAAYNRAILTGPHMHNFSEELALMLDKQAIIQVDDLESLKQNMIRLLDNPDARLQLQKNTRALVHDVENILENYTRLILTAA